MHHPSFNHKQVDHRAVADSNTYYWIIAKSKSGRTLIYGCKSTMEQAKEAVSKIHNADCEIVPLKTHDEDEATRMLRGRTLEQTGDVDAAYRRFNHTNRA